MESRKRKNVSTNDNELAKLSKSVQNQILGIQTQINDINTLLKTANDDYISQTEEFRIIDDKMSKISKPGLKN
jgi:cellobiose phosphorylase